MPPGGAYAAYRPIFGQRRSRPDDGAPPCIRSGNGRERRVTARILPGLAEFFSIEASFALFLFAGQYKGLPELRGFPVDFTLLFFVVTFCLIAWAIVSGRMKPAPLSLSVLLMLLFSELAVASLFWSSLDPRNTDKALRFLLLTSTSFFVAHMLAQDRGRQARLARTIAWLSCAILLYDAYYRYVLGAAVIAGDELDPGRYGPRANNYLQYGSHANILFIVFLSLAAFGSLKQLCVAVFGSGAVLYLLLIMGGRGPLAAALLAIPLLALGLLRCPSGSLRRLSHLMALLSGLIVVAAVGYVVVERLEGSGAALERQFRTLDRYQGDDTSSMNGRLEGRDVAFDMWLQKPILGWGIGEFRVKDSYLEYPHNMLLEILAEMGIIGGFLFIVVCTVAVRDCIGIAKDRTCEWTDAAIALLFLTQLALLLTVQGYLADDRAFFAYMGLVIGSRVAAGRSPRPAAPFPGLQTRASLARERLIREGTR
jgi:O-antigen ligase